MTVFLKDPDEVLDYEIDWGNELVSDSPVETISTSSWAVAPNTLTVDSDSNTNTTAKAFFSGGTRGTVYRATNTITTSQSRTLERSVIIRIAQR